MHFLIADTFTDSLANLTNEEQKAVKTTAFDLQMNPANPGMQFHKIDKARDANFWSVRVNRDIRLIVHKSQNSLLLCYVDHHDKAYQWAERRKLETHPKTGSAQLVEIRETVREISIPKHVEAEQPKPLPFSALSDNELLSYGVPEEWLNDVRGADEDSILEIAEHLPAEAAEALLDLAVGVTPQPISPVATEVAPFDHPDAQRRFRVMNNVEELERALDFPWEKWTIFLHPAQRRIVEKEFNGPARVSGSAGTGKTIVALHRAVFLARSNQDARVLLTTFSEALANALRIKLRRLISNEPKLAERLEVHAINAIGIRLYELNFGKPVLADSNFIKQTINKSAAKTQGHHFSEHFLHTEWEQVVDAWQLKSWEAYRDVLRLGRKTRLPESRRKVLWSIFVSVISTLQSKHMITYARLFDRLSDKFRKINQPLFDFVIVDEAQDISVVQLRFLAALGHGRPNSLFFAGDLGQRIFQQPFSWKSLGVDIRGRSQSLKINYRTSHQIRTRADRLLGPEISDVDGIKEDRRGTISVFNGPKPIVKIVDSEDIELEVVSNWLKDRMAEGVLANEIGVFVRSENELKRAIAAIDKSGLKHVILNENINSAADHISVSTMHLAKGLEFRAVVVMACDDEVIPLQERIEMVSDDTDLEEVYNTERHLLYVACTRARDHLLVTGIEPASEFLDDLLI